MQGPCGGGNIGVQETEWHRRRLEEGAWKERGMEICYVSLFHLIKNV